MANTCVEVGEASIRIVDLEVPVREVADFFRGLPVEERPFTLMKAIEVGVFCLERGRTAQDTDFVKRKVAELLVQVENAVIDIPKRAEENLLQKIGVLAKAVKAQVEEALRPLVSEVDNLAKEVRGQEAAAEAIEQTTLKGAPYEEEVTGLLRNWAKAVGAEVHHVGGDNLPGDVNIMIPADGIIAQPMTIVVEVRDRGSRAMGRKAIAAEMTAKMAARKATAGIYLSRTQDGLSLREIGEWAEGSCDYGPWVACTHQHLSDRRPFLNRTAKACYASGHFTRGRFRFNRAAG